jgi:hypothetical protein
LRSPTKKTVKLTRCLHGFAAQVILRREAGFFDRLHAHSAKRQAWDHHVASELVRRNTEAVSAAANPEMRRAALSARSEERDARAAEARVQRLNLDTAFRRAAEADLAWRLSATERKHTREAAARVREMQELLLIWLSMERAAAGMRLAYQGEVEWRRQVVKMRTAARVIMARYKRYKRQRSSRREAEALVQLAFHLPGMIRRWRVRSMGRKAAIIVNYLREMSSFARLQLAVKQFRRRIVRAQRIVRAWLDCKRARSEILERQFDRTDAERNGDHDRRRAAMVRRIKEGLDRQLQVKGKAAAVARARLFALEAVGGRRAVEALRMEVGAARERLCARFMGLDMQHLPQISPLVRAKMLELYARKMRVRYQRELAAYRIKRAVWTELEASQAEIRAFARHYADSLGDRPSAEHLRAQIRAVVPDPEPPRRPPRYLVLPQDLMAQVIQKAVEHSLRLAERCGGGPGLAGGGGGEGRRESETTEEGGETG